MITIMNMVYLRITKAVVDWENHKFQSSADNSLILKNFFFQFFNSYIYLGYLVVIQKQTIDQLEVTIIVHIATSMGSFLGINFAMPYALFLWKRGRIRKKWAEFQANFYLPYFKDKPDPEKSHKIDKESQKVNPLTTEQESPNDQKVYLLPPSIQKEDPDNNDAMEYTREDSELHKQIEFTTGMNPFSAPQDVFMFLVCKIN